MKLNIKNLGQVFTPAFIVADMISLIKNKGNILEPSSGDGAFVTKLNSVTHIEYDAFLATKTNAINMDFFDYDIKNKFDTIIGNPPYVRYQDINEDTKEKLKKYNKLFDERTSLYLFFIYKCILHLKNNGELIFVTPRDFLKLTCSKKLNEFIFAQGTITNIIELGDKKVFENACPNTIIWRFEKGSFKRLTNITKEFIVNNGQILFTKNKYSLTLKEIAFVKVGAVSGADKYFINKNGKEFVCSYTNKTGETKKMLYNENHRDLEKHKVFLIQRKIKNFTENNWYEWGRKYYESEALRVYVNGKTRNKNPFFLHKEKAYDGAVLAIFPLKKMIQKELENFCEMLNKVDWEELGFVVDGRFIFSQRSLENTLLPSEFNIFL